MFEPSYLQISHVIQCACNYLFIFYFYTEFFSVVNIWILFVICLSIQCKFLHEFCVGYMKCLIIMKSHEVSVYLKTSEMWCISPYHKSLKSAHNKWCNTAFRNYLINVIMLFQFLLFSCVKHKRTFCRNLCCSFTYKKNR